MFVTAQGSAYARFRRSLDNRSLGHALACAAEIKPLGLTDSLELLLLIRDKAPERYGRAAMRWHSRLTSEAGERADYLRQVPAAVRFISAEPLLGPPERLELAGIHWLIAGGESGPRHRPVAARWLRDLRDRCKAEDVAFFFKQWGRRHSTSGGRRLDGKTYSAMTITHAKLGAQQ